MFYTPDIVWDMCNFEVGWRVWGDVSSVTDIIINGMYTWFVAVNELKW